MRAATPLSLDGPRSHRTRSHADADGGAPVGEVEEVEGDEEHERRDNALLGQPLDGGMGEGADR